MLTVCRALPVGTQVVLVEHKNNSSGFKSAKPSVLGRLLKTTKEGVTLL